MLLHGQRHMTSIRNARIGTNADSRAGKPWETSEMSDSHVSDCNLRSLNTCACNRRRWAPWLEWNELSV